MNPEASQAIGWLVTVIHVLLAIVLLVVALVRLRGASAAGAYLVAASSGVEALGSCCGRGLSTWIRSRAETMGYESVDTMYTAQSVLSLLINLIAGALLVAGLAVAARAITARRAS